MTAAQQPRFIDIIISNWEFVVCSLTLERRARAAALQFPRRASCRLQGGFTIGDARFEMRRFEFSCSRPLAPSYRVSVTNGPAPPAHLTDKD